MIDWGILSNLRFPEGKNVGYVPGKPSAMDQFANGLLSGVRTGQQIVSTNQQQQMNQMALQQQQQQNLYQNNLNQAYQSGGVDAYKAAMNPNDRMRFEAAQLSVEQQKADIANTMSETANNQSDDASSNKVDEQDARNLASIHMGNVAHASSQGATPQENEAIYQQQLKQYPDLKDSLPAHYDNAWAHAAMISGKETLDSIAAQNAAENGKSNATSSFGKSFETSPAAQKQFVDLDQNTRNVNLGMRTADTLQGQLNSIPENAFNPITGSFNAKYTAQGEAIKKNINLLVTQAPSILGLPASALRAATVWKMIQDSKPSDKMWTVANKAMLDDIKYMGSLQAESNWKQQAQMMKAQSLTGSEGAKDEASQWLKDNPEPIKSAPIPDLKDFYKLFPNMKGSLEKDWNTIKNGKVSADTGTSTQAPSSNQPSNQFKEGQKYRDANGKEAIYQNGQWIEQ